MIERLKKEKALLIQYHDNLRRDNIDEAVDTLILLEELGTNARIIQIVERMALIP